MQLSLVIITLNAAQTLEKCLVSAKSYVNDIIIVDSGSQDETIPIAISHDARVIKQRWLGFGPQKQFAVQQAQHDWVLCLDSDEWISENLAIEIKERLTINNIVAYKIPRCNKFMGRFLRHGEGYPDLSIRLFNRNYAQWSSDLVHEKVIYNGMIGKLDGEIMHESGESIYLYLEKQNKYTDIQAAEIFTKCKKRVVLNIIISPIFRFIKFYFLRRGFLDGLPGFVHIIIGCFNTFIKYVKLNELIRKDKFK